MPSTPAAPRTAAQGTVTILLTLLGWSSVPLFLKHFSTSIDAWTSNGWRYGAAALVWAPVTLLAWKRKDAPPNLWRAAIVPALFNSVGQTFFTLAHYLIDPGLLSFGLRMQIITVAVGAFLLFPGERAVVRSPRYIAGFLLVLSGVSGAALLGAGPVEPGHLAGVGMAALAGVLFGGYALSVKKCMHGMPPIISFAAISQYTAGAMITLMLLLGERQGAGALDLPAGQFSLLILSAIIGIALGHVFYYIAIASLGVAVASGVIQLQPFVVGTASQFLFGEALTAWQWLAGSGAVVGALLILSAQRKMTIAPLGAPEGAPLAPSGRGAAGDDVLEAVTSEGVGAIDIRP